MRGARIIYSAAQMAWLEANRFLQIREYHAGFVAEFGRHDVTAANLHSLRKRRGWKKGRANMKGYPIKYSPEEMAWLERNRALPITEYRAAFREAFGRDVSAQGLHALRKRKGWKTGRTGHFAKGAEPANKGKTCPEGTGGRHPNARRSQFKKGQLPHNTKYLGHERVSIDGYVEISVAETNPHTGYERCYVLKHLRLWEAVNGPVPEGHCLKCLDGDKTNTDPDNWALIPRAILPRLNGGRNKKHLAVNDAAPELRPTIIAIAQVDHRARQLRRRAR